MGDFQTFTFHDKLNEDLYLFKHQLEAFKGDLDDYTRIIAMDESWRNAVIDWMMDDANVVLARHAFYVIRSYSISNHPSAFPHVISYLSTTHLLSCQQKYYLFSVLLLMDDSYQLNECIQKWMHSLSVSDLSGLFKTLKMSPRSYSVLFKHFLSQVTVFSKHLDSVYLSMFLSFDESNQSFEWSRQLLLRLSASKDRKTRHKACELLNQLK